MKQNVSLAYSWDEYYLPVLDAVVDNKDEVLKLQEVFNIVINGLEDKIIKKFGKDLDVEIVLYLGLCNGAGWVSEVDDKTLILLGVEKIIELKWNNINDLNGLIIHELGHAYQKQYGVIELASNELGDNFMWQLFIEGIAMVFEQEILEDINYFHQDRDDYLVWCKNNIKKNCNRF